MAIKYGFYNSVGGDRTYDAVDISSMFDGVITDGVFESIGNKLVVTDGTGMNVIVGTGKAWFDHTYTINDAALTLAIAASDLVLPRIDTVVLEVNASNAVRANTIKVITGTPATIPNPPALTNTSEIHQYPLAHVSVAAAETEIDLADITDMVGTVDTPFVTVPGASGTGGAAVLEVQVFS